MTIQIKDLLKNHYIKIGFIVFASIVISLGMVWARAFYGSMQAYRQGEKFLKQQKYIRAITFFDRSIHWYTPINPYVQRSAERLWEIGSYAQREGDIKLALIAYRTIRSGFIATSSFYTPGNGWVEKCELKIKELVRMEEKGTEGKGHLNTTKEEIPQIQKRVTPSILWSIVVEIGFLGWIGGVIGFIMFGIRRKKGAPHFMRSFFLWITFTTVFFGLWIIGMMKA
jgi:hypothetical protein